MKEIYNISLILALGIGILLLPLRIQAQTPHQVINSAGGDRPAASGTLVLTDNVGEPFVSSEPGGNFLITQGFLQIFSIAPQIQLEVLKSDVTCLGKKDGRISTSLTNFSDTTVRYLWSDTTLCPPSDNCSELDSLGAMTLTLTVLVTRPAFAGSTLTVTDTLREVITISDLNPPCQVTVFTGVTANEDNINDFFHIKNIDQFPNNRVSIYNRWGNLMYEQSGYNQDFDDKRWPTKDHLETLVSGTYFYILDLGEGGGLIKGWVELLKN